MSFADFFGVHVPIQNTKRAEHVRVIGATVAFNLLCRSKIFRLQPADDAILLDVGLSLYTRSEPVTKAPTFELVYPNNVRIVIAHREGKQEKQLDITDQILSKMRALIDAADQSDIRNQLEAGMRSGLDAINRIRGANAGDVSKMSARLAMLPLSSLLTVLGERTSESLGGVLSLANYIYSYVQIPCISLEEILVKNSLSFQELKHPSLMVMHGVSDEAPIGGEVELTLECAYHNELIDEFDDLEYKIKARLLEIHEALSSDGPIIQGIMNAKDSIMRFQRQLNDFGSRLQDQTALIKSLLRAEASLEQKWADLQKPRKTDGMLP